MTFKSPKDTACSMDTVGCAKMGLGTGRLLTLGFLAGAYIAFGGILAVIVGGGMPGIAADNPGLQKFVFGATFPVGLMLVILAGAELFTGNTATCIPAVLNGSTRWTALARNWGLSYVGNFIGSLFVAYVLAYLAGLFLLDPWHANIVAIAQSKGTQDFLPLFVKAIGCNWLVCLAVWLAAAADDVSGKILGIWFPIMAFVAIGFEHSVANMFFIPAGMLYGANVTWAQFLLGNLVPVTLGNIVGGALFVGVAYWYIYGAPGRATK